MKNAARSVDFIRIYAASLEHMGQAMNMDAYFSISGPLTEKAAALIEKRFEQLAETRPMPENVHVLLWSQGGEVEAGLKIYHLFSRFKIPITIYTTCAKSAGALVFLGGHHRKITRDCSIMFHAAVASLPGHAKIDEIAGALAKARRDDKRMRLIVDKHLKPVSAKEWKEYASGDWSPTTARLIRAGVVRKKDVTALLPMLPPLDQIKCLWRACDERCPTCATPRVVEHF